MIVAAATAKTTAQISMRRPATLSDVLISERIFGDEDAAHQDGEETGGDEGQPLLDEFADRLAEVTQQLGLEEEAGAAGDDRQHNEHEEVITGKARGDGHDL